MDETMTEERIRVLGASESVVTRSRKGRSSFRVTRRHARRMVGPDPVAAVLARLDDGDDDVWGDPTLATLDGTTLAALADAWVARFDPEQAAHTCSCDDLTAVWERNTGRTVRHTPEPGCQGPSVTVRTSGDYATRERTVRRCHCRTWSPLLGSDLGRSWAEITAGDSSTGRRRVRVSLSMRPRESDPTGDERSLTAPYVTSDRMWVGHTLVRRAPARGRNTARAERTAARRAAREVTPEEATLTTVWTDGGTVTFPDVTVTVRVRPNSPHGVTIVRGGQTIRMSARTPAAVARRVIA